MCENKWYNVNLNHTVKVRLTDKGRDIYYHQNDKLNQQYNKIMIKPKYPVEVNGYYSTQLWNLMAIFGEHIFMGMDIPFETTIEIENKDTP